MFCSLASFSSRPGLLWSTQLHQIVTTSATSEVALATAMATASKLKKTAVITTASILVDSIPSGAIIRMNGIKIGTALTDGAGQWTFTTVALNDGSNRFSANATDASGNKSVNADSYTMVVDTTAPGAPASGTLGRAFPTPAAMAAEKDAFYRDVVRAGYRGAYLRDIARRVARGDLDLESLATSDEDDERVRERLLALPGVGPYAAAHILMTLGRHSRLILDSWTRPTYARMAGKRTVADATIERRFRRYGAWAGLAFWLTCTRDWVAD